MLRTRRKSSVYSRFARHSATPSRALSTTNEKQVIAELKAEIALLHATSTDTIYRLRYRSMTYDYISPNVVKLLGYRPDELNGMNFRDLILETRNIHDGMRTVDDFGGLEMARRQGETVKWQADYHLRTKDGREIWVADISYPWVDEDGAIIGSVGSLRDITDRVEAETHLRAELVAMANTDFLTGLHNRRFFFERMDQELKRQQRSGESLSMMLIDLDHFKKINDRFGHPEGDAVLKKIANIILSCLRETDVAARVGGEEFAVLLPETSDEGAYWVADRIRNEVAAHRFELRNVVITCTVSIGVAGSPKQDHLNGAQLYKLADTRLYIAKHTGRNQVSMDEVLNLH